MFGLVFHGKILSTYFNVFKATILYKSYIFLAPNFIGPPVTLVALLASSSFCRCNFRSSRFLRASSKRFAETLYEQILTIE